MTVNAEVQVTAGFEPVREVFAKATAGLASTGAAYSVTVDGKPVVDLVAGQSHPGTPWSVDTPAVLMSVTKGFASLCAAILVERGQLDVDALVSDYWPEFAANGKQDVTVRQVMLHTAGVIGLPDSAAVLGWDGRGWHDLDAIAASLAASTPAWTPGTKHGYHAVTFGWLAGELVRRITGKTLGTFFQDEVAGPLGIRAAVGVTRERAAEVGVVEHANLFDGPWIMRKMLGRLTVAMRDPSTKLGSAFLGDGTRSIMDGVGDLLADPRFLEAEVPSSNGISSAHDLARLFGALACGGTVDGVTVLAPETLALFTAKQLRAEDAVMADSLTFPGAGLLRRKMAITRSLGFGLESPHFPGRPGVFGAEGAGGQAAYADPDAKLSIAFVRSGLSSSTEPFKSLVKATYACL